MPASQLPHGMRRGQKQRDTFFRTRVQHFVYTNSSARKYQYRLPVCMCVGILGLKGLTATGCVSRMRCSPRTTIRWKRPALSIVVKVLKRFSFIANAHRSGFERQMRPVNGASCASFVWSSFVSNYVLETGCTHSSLSCACMHVWIECIRDASRTLSSRRLAAFCFSKLSQSVIQKWFCAMRGNHNMTYILASVKNKSTFAIVQHWNSTLN